MRRAVLFLALFILTGVLAGCTSWMTGSYVSVKPHAEVYAQTEPQDTEVASYYQQLRDAFLILVERYSDKGVVDVSQYGSALESDLERAAAYVTDQDPMGAYAVSKIQYELKEVGARRVAAVEISYRKTLEEMQEIQAVWGPEGVRTKVATALDAFTQKLTLRVSGYETLDLTKMVEDYYSSHLNSVMECPRVTASLYPRTGTVRLMEIRFHYSTSQETMRSMRREVQTIFSSASGYVGKQLPDLAKATRLYSFLMALYSEAGPSVTPAYSLLCQGVGDSESFALVYAALCRQSELECQVVRGTHGGKTWYWNIVCLDGVYYHVDLMGDRELGRLNLRSDPDMEAYDWDQSAYPSCEVPPEPEVTVPEETQPQPAQTGSTESAEPAAVTEIPTEPSETTVSTMPVQTEEVP